MAMKYFRLASDCFLVEGGEDGAIYDVHGRRVYLMDEEAHRILRRCEDNEPLGDWVSEPGMRFLEALQEEDLGYFDSGPAHIDKLLLNQPVEWKGMCMVPPKFFKVDWGITNQCDLNCAFCGHMGETISWQSCQTCLRRQKEAASQWAPENPEQFVAHLTRLGVQVLHIRGGNPLLAWEYLLSVVQAVRQTSLSLIITTPGTGRETDELIDLCRGGQVRLNIVMFGVDDEVTSTVCGQEGVLRHQLELTAAFAEADIPFFLTFFLSDATRLQRHKILEFVRDRWTGTPSFAEVHFKDAMGEGFRLSHVEEQAKQLTPWRSAEDFFFRVRHNSCTFGNFEISADGKLRSCAGIHQVRGDVLADGLRNALAGNSLYEVWESDKGSVQPCRHCVLRYACTDCSVFEFAGEEDSRMKEAYCPHNPGRNAPRAHAKNWSAPAGFVGALRVAGKKESNLVSG